MALTETGTISSSAPATAAGRNRWEGEMGFCEHCGSRVSSYPMGCPGCGAPECCQRCCDEQNKNDRIAALESRVRELEAERDEARRNYQWMVERAADQKLDGYRELGARAANAENALDEAEAAIARQREWIESAGHRRKCSVRAPHAATMDYKPTCDCGWAELAEG